MIDFQLIDRSSGDNAQAGLTVVATINTGAGYQPSGGSVSDLGGGLYRYTPSAAELLEDRLAVRLSELSSISQIINFREVAKNQVAQHVDIQLVDKDGTDGDDTAATVTVSVDGGDYGPGGGTVNQRGDGVIQYTPSQAETNSNHLAIRVVEPTSITTVLNVYPSAADVTPDFPDSSDVRQGVEYNNGQETGTLNLPATKDVRDGITFDNAQQTGILVLPLEVDVREGTTYGANDEFTGTLVVGAGNLPAIADVREGVNFGEGLVGTLVVPSADDVRLGVVFDGITTGNCRIPTPTQVTEGVDYDSNDSVSGRFFFLELSFDQVRAGVNYGPGEVGGPGGWTGTRTDAAALDVRAGVQYGGDGTSLTGLLAVPPATRVIDGVAVDQTVGNFTYPTEQQVLAGIPFGANGNEFTGTLDPAGGVVPRYPRQGEVLDGVEFGDEGTLQYRGTLRLPDVSVVLAGETFGEDGTEFTGTLLAISVFAEDGETIRTVRGDSYTGTEAIVFKNPGWWPDFTGRSVLVGLDGLDGRHEFPATVDGQDIKLELSKADTEPLRGWFDYDVEATSQDGNQRTTAARGRWGVLSTQTNIPANQPLNPGSLW